MTNQSPQSNRSADVLELVRTIINSMPDNESTDAQQITVGATITYNPTHHNQSGNASQRKVNNTDKSSSECEYLPRVPEAIYDHQMRMHVNSCIVCMKAWREGYAGW